MFEDMCMLAGWILMDYWNFELNEDDIAQLAPIGKAVFGEAQEPHFVERMVFDWGNFARNLGEDFDTNIYDYQNDVWVRQSLQEILQATPEPLRSKIKSFVNDIDRRFLELTAPAPQPVINEAQPDQWWWWRLPCQYGQELRADLVKWGIRLS